MGRLQYCSLMGDEERILAVVSPFLCLDFNEIGSLRRWDSLAWPPFRGRNSMVQAVRQGVRGDVTLLLYYWGEKDNQGISSTGMKSCKTK